MRLAFQKWRAESGLLKVLPTFAASGVVQALEHDLDVMPDVYLSADRIAQHLDARRVDLVISSTLDLAGELIQKAQADPQSPYLAVPLLDDAVLLGLNPAHPLAGLQQAGPEDCAAFPSAGYPEGLARLGAEALLDRGVWRFACRQSRFDRKEWMLGMRSPAGLCYRTALLLDLIPESRELKPLEFSQPLRQTTCVLVLKELAQEPAVEKAVALIRRELMLHLQHCDHDYHEVL